MFGRSFARALKQECNAFKAVVLRRTEARRQLFVRRGTSVEVVWLNQFTSSHSYVVRRYFSQNVFSDVFSDLSKQQFIKSIEEIKCKEKDKGPRDAAVLVPLCKVNGKPSVLLTLRSAKMGRHKGDVSFPGGMRDISDKDVVDLALRETEEEIGIAPDGVQVWTTMPGISPSRSGMKVTPVIAFIGNVNLKDCVVNRSEVEEVFSFTLESLCDPHHLFYTQFKSGYTLPVYIVGEYRVWGLTAVILHHFLMILLPNIYINNSPLTFKNFNLKHRKEADITKK